MCEAPSTWRARMWRMRSRLAHRRVERVDGRAGDAERCRDALGFQHAHRGFRRFHLGHPCFLLVVGVSSLRWSVSLVLACLTLLRTSSDRQVVAGLLTSCPGAGGSRGRASPAAEALISARESCWLFRRSGTAHRKRRRSGPWLWQTPPRSRAPQRVNDSFIGADVVGAHAVRSPEQTELARNPFRPA